MLYKAFISYSHAADGKLAPALQFALHRFARRWYALRAMRVFRDETNLAISPHLWGEIEKALGESEFFLLLASPQASASKWVPKEVEFWLKNCSGDKLLIIVTDGEVIWDSAAGDFDWTKTTALPSNLAKVFPEEPLYLDFRWAKTTEHLSLNNPTFRDKIADIASSLQGRPKDELIGEDVREHRKVKRLTWSAVAALTLLTLASVGAAWFAITERDQAIEQAIRTRVNAGLLALNSTGGPVIHALVLTELSQFPITESAGGLNEAVKVSSWPIPTAVLQHKQGVMSAA